MHHHSSVVIFVGVVVLVAVAMAVLAAVAIAFRRRTFAGPTRDQWQEARRELGWKDRYRLWWGDVQAPAGRQRQARPSAARVHALRAVTSERSPLTHRWVTFVALIWAFVTPRAATGMPGRMEQPRRQIDDLHGALSA